MESIIAHLISELTEEIANLPDGFHNSFNYMTASNNRVHPITWGILSKILYGIDGTKYVAIDMRLNQTSNDQRFKFQPDLTALAEIEPLVPTLFLDYESPNSSDMRIPKKDVVAYQEWSKASGLRVPFVIVTTLPNRPSGKWKLRYTTTTNLNFVGMQSKIYENPFQFWYGEYRKTLSHMGSDLDMIYFINIDGKTVNDATHLVQSG